MSPKPHWKRTYVQEADGLRIITMSAVVPHPDAPGGELRVWMDEVWELPAQPEQEKRLLDDRTSYRNVIDGRRYATLERCLEEAYVKPAAIETTETH